MEMKKFIKFNYKKNLPFLYFIIMVTFFIKYKMLMTDNKD